MPPKPDRPLFWMGKYLSLALVLPSSVAAGYLLGAFADHYFKTSLLRVVGILLGMASGLIHVLKELARDEKRNSN